MSSSPSHISKRLQDVECSKGKDNVADVHNWDGAAVEAVCSEKTKNKTEALEHTEHMLSKTPVVKECQNVGDIEVIIEDHQLDSVYSWVIVCASFVNCFIVGTMFIGFSILYVEITEYFGSSKGVTGWIGSLYMASGNVFGKFYCLLLSSWHCCKCLRKVQLAGINTVTAIIMFMHEASRSSFIVLQQCQYRSLCF